MLWGCTWGRGLALQAGVLEDAWQRGPLTQGCPAHTAPALLPSSLIFSIPHWQGPKPQHMGGKEPSL